MSPSIPRILAPVILSLAASPVRLECQAMPNFIKHMYREFLQGHTDIIKVDEDLTLAPRGSGKLFIQKDRYSNKWNAQNTCIGHQGRWTFCHEALAAAYLQGADIAQLVMLDDLLDRGDCGRFPVHPTPGSRETAGTRSASASPASARCAPTGTTPSSGPARP